MRAAPDIPHPDRGGVGSWREDCCAEVAGRATLSETTEETPYQMPETSPASPGRPVAPPRLTICTVSFGHEELIEMNARLAARLNPDFCSEVAWWVADNAADGALERSGISHPAIQVRPGSSDTSLGASHHHALAMNALVAQVRSRFLLVLDPDFYLLAPGWVDRVLSHMVEADLAFFGAPWHPRYTRSYRYFPAVHCMFVDLSKVDAAALDFRPRLELIDPPPRRDLAEHIPPLRQRRRVPWDTGVRVFERFGRDPRCRAECVTTVFRRSLDLPAGPVSRFIEALLPDGFCYVPKDRSSWSEAGFRERGWCTEQLPSLWEETIWQDRPFGLHMRRSYAAGSREAADESSLLPRVLAQLESVSAPVRETAPVSA